MTSLEIKVLVDRMTTMGVPKHPRMLSWTCYGEWTYHGGPATHTKLADEDAEAILAAHYWRWIRANDTARDIPEPVPVEWVAVDENHRGRRYCYTRRWRNDCVTHR